MSPLQRVLRDYIQEGIASVIPWHYDNCMTQGGMASGRALNVYLDCSDTSNLSTCNNIPTKVKHFFPPRAIAQTAALASCYTRIRTGGIDGSPLSKYLFHMDDDEFITLSSTSVLHHIHHTLNVSFANRPTVSSTSNGGNRDSGKLEAVIKSSQTLTVDDAVDAQLIEKPLVWLADKTFSRYPQMTALNFIPVLGIDCSPGTDQWSDGDCKGNDKNKREKVKKRNEATRDGEIHRHLAIREEANNIVKETIGEIKRSHVRALRMSKLTHTLLDKPYIGKLLMRTDMVEMFFVHYLTLLNPKVLKNPANQDGYLATMLDLHPAVAALTHIRQGYWSSPKGGDIFGESLPVIQHRNYSQCTLSYGYYTNITSLKQSQSWFIDREAEYPVVLIDSKTKLLVRQKIKDRIVKSRKTGNPM